jgi:hypothetical protein
MGSQVFRKKTETNEEDARSGQMRIHVQDSIDCQLDDLFKGFPMIGVVSDEKFVILSFRKELCM